MIASNRRHMADMLDERMRRSRAESVADSGLNGDSAYVKTFMVEATLPEDAKPKDAAAFVESLFPRTSSLAQGLSLTQAKGGDTLFSIQTTLSGEHITAYLDFTNPRFWLLHSMSDSAKLDKIVAKWINEIPQLDRAWLPSDFLESCDSLGSLRGIGLFYDRRWVPDTDPDAIPVDILKMQFRGSIARHVLGIMKADNAAPHQTSLSRVTIRLDGGQGVDDIKYDGKVTGRGKSFTDHLALTYQIYDRYMRQIRKLENEYAIRGGKNKKRFQLDGEPIAFRFTTPITDLAKFCEGMFSGSAPFRLWGVPTRRSGDYFTVQALDLHSGRSLSFEISPELIRVYLPAGSCGNSILRFYTNIQHRYDALIEVVNGSGEPVFAF